MQARYRSDYPGEFVVTETRWSGGSKHQEREWVPNPIENQHISHRAACIGTGSDQYKFDYTKLQRHRGGLLSSKKLQTYGTGKIANHMRLDFTVELDKTVLNELIDQKYDENNIIYSSARNCLNWPGHLYLVPYFPHLLTEVLPIYLAAFDGHREIFLLGYNNDCGIESSIWPQQLGQVFACYSGTKFYLIGEQSNMPAELFEHTNVEHFNVQQFISYCDV
jgi:hypothetical protein